MYARIFAPVTLALLLVACGAPSPQAPERVTSTAAPTAIATTSATASPSPSATPSVPEQVIISPVETPAEGGPSIDQQTTGGGEMPEGLDEAVIVYQRSGGLTGQTEWWAIFPDGRVMSKGGQGGQVAPERVSELLANLEALGFFDMQTTYLPDDPCCDRYTHTLTVRQDGQAKTITTLDATPGVPDTLWQAIDAIMALANSAS